MYFALIIWESGPSPVMTGEENDKMATWDTYGEASRECNAMPISQSREILIFPIEDGMPPA